jgi:hypothetical protein
MNRSLLHAVAVALFVAGCGHTEAATGTGTGVGVSRPAALPVRFSWTSSDGGQTGTMTATLGSRTFTGRFEQIRQEIQTEEAAPLWRARSRRWHDWAILGSWSSCDVVANLASPDGAQIRCRFHVPDPAAGIDKGGEGECEDGNETITAVLDAR